MENEIHLPALPAIERRTVSLREAEVRDGDDGVTFEGHAAVFDSWSEDLGGFRETIKRGAFRKALKSGHDIRFLVNHDPDKVLARSTVKSGPGSLSMSEDEKGLNVRAHFSNTQLARDLRELVRDRVVTQMSFAWPYGTVRDTIAEGDTLLERTIHEFRELRDVSAVTFPAYASTTASMRSLECGNDLAEDDLRRLANEIHAGRLVASDEERAAIDAAFARLEQLSPWMEELARRALGIAAARTADQGSEDTDPAEATVGEPDKVPAAARRRRLSLRTIELTGATT
jgi:hypothetical protein